MTEVERIINDGILPESFFGEEVQCGFRVSKKRKQLWAVSFDLLLEFDRVCGNHGLKYYLIGGTLLGVARHQGFIPWDDDIDVAMFRDDYEKLLTLSSEFKLPYFLQTPYTDKDYFFSMCRLRNSNSSYISSPFIYRDFNMGVQLDIFPLDNWVEEEAHHRFELIDYLIKDLSTWMRMNNPRLASEERERIKMWSGKNPMSVYEEMQSIATQFNHIDSEYTSLAVCTAYSYKKLTWKKTWFEGEKRMVFLGYEFPVPNDFEEILKTEYGEWRTFPPMEQRGNWHSSAYVDLDISYKELVIICRSEHGIGYESFEKVYNFVNDR